MSFKYLVLFVVFAMAMSIEPPGCQINSAFDTAITGVPEFTFQIPAFNRNGRLGFLYSGYQNRVGYPGVFASNVPGECTWTTPAYSTAYKSTVAKSRSSYLESLDVSMDLQLSILAGTTEMDASTGYSAVKETRTDAVRGVITATVTTTEVGFYPYCSNVTSAYVPYRILDSEYTHYVSAILYGFQFHLVFESLISEKLTKSEIEAKLGVDLNQLANTLTAKVGYTSSSTEQHESFGFTINFIGDVLPPSQVLTTMANVSDFVKQAVENITRSAKHTKEYGKPLRYFLTPLSELVPMVSNEHYQLPFKRLSTFEEFSCIQNLNELERTQSLLIQLMSDSTLMDLCESDIGKALLFSNYRKFSTFLEEYRFNASVNAESKRKGMLQSIKVACPSLANSTYSYKDMLKFKDNYKSIYDVADIVSHFKVQGISCLRSSLSSTLFPLEFLNQTVLILSFYKSRIHDNLPLWSSLTDKYMKFCDAGYGVLCKIVHCDGPSYICTHSYPVIKVFSESSFHVYEDDKLQSLFTFMKTFIKQNKEKYIMTRVCIEESMKRFHTEELPAYLNDMGSYSKYAFYEDISWHVSKMNDFAETQYQSNKRYSRQFPKENHKY